VADPRDRSRDFAFAIKDDPSEPLSPRSNGRYLRGASFPREARRVLIARRGKPHEACSNHTPRHGTSALHKSPGVISSLSRSDSLSEREIRSQRSRENNGEGARTNQGAEDPLLAATRASRVNRDRRSRLRLTARARAGGGGRWLREIAAGKKARRASADSLAGRAITRLLVPPASSRRTREESVLTKERGGKKTSDRE